MVKKVTKPEKEAKNTEAWALRAQMLYEYEAHLFVLYDYRRVVDHFLDVARFAEGGYHASADYNEVLGIATRAEWTLPGMISTAESMLERTKEELRREEG